MKKFKALLNFTRLSIIEKIGFFRNVIEKMTGNVDFPTPDVPLVEATALVSKLEASYYAARDGSHTAVAYMYQCEEEADDCFRTLAAYVTRASAGEESKILGTGFLCSKEPSPRPKAELIVKEGTKPGSFILRRHTVLDARSYLWQYSQGDLPASDANWKVLNVTTKSKNEATGLTSGLKYWFRVAAVTPEGTGAFTPAVSKIAQ
jgi:hypothetical protein